ncbi:MULTISPECIES: orotate phosphoribosyltransferase [unclassified Fusibacter]|uniref:orotate phosphoribosyltransferase n=1 Tax=unclassified Fusibacter TaxID=2624464 RepID=UPI001012A701|nr:MULTISPECIES: orotate phosphoribosyltransferase [unclassified Fusibacter]MCK8058659.1 orotate phosphoribosyltransferase [Fusibacter sp. A2]NPE21734.1 orotate phosphoribosyltransferase [Fusibacter sp. A1]RXV61308.1 orotate phosphoribosyltransferase [Fusibacter sp. A1]
MKQYKKDFIELMIESGVLTFGEFTTKSGRLSPFFINAGNFKFGNHLRRLGEFYAQAIVEEFESFDVLFGPSYKGIPLSVATVMALDSMYGRNVEYCSNRKEMKTHGDTGILLGSTLKKADRILMIEDVTTAGTSIYETMPILKDLSDAEIVGLIISVDRMEKGKGEKSAIEELTETYGMKISSIVTMKEVIEYLSATPIGGKLLIDTALRTKIDAYYAEYGIN